MRPRKSLGDLLAETPQMIVDLAKAEIQRLKDEVAAKAKGFGAGGVLLALAGVVALYLLGWLLYAAYQGLNAVFAPWLSALIVSVLLLIVVAILALWGLSLIKKNKDFDDLEAIDSIKDDVNMVRGVGHAAAGTDPLDDLPTSTPGAAGATRIPASGASATTRTSTTTPGSAATGMSDASRATGATRAAGDVR